MNIYVNGRPFEIETPATLAQLLEKLQLPHTRVAVERNQQVIPRIQWDHEQIAEGDRIEIVQFVGGGIR